MSTAQAQAAPPRFTALALQTRCDAVNQDQTRGAARERMRAAIARVGGEIAAARGFLQGFNGYDARLVVLPEYWMTGYPLGETRQLWQDKAAIDVDGPESAAIGEIAQRHRLFLCSNHYENDARFPDLYFQSNVIFGPNGDPVLRYRRMISLYTPTPYDVWDRYLDAYGADAIFPVADTEIGLLGSVASEEILYPEIARMHVFKGAEILVHPTSEVFSPNLTPKHIAKMARAVENMAYVVSANSAGIYGTPAPAHATDAMSIVIDWYGRTLAEAGPGESFNANAVLDVAALRDARRRTGMTNLLSRLPLDAFEGPYRDTALAPANRTPDGRMIERPEVIQRQRDVIERLARDGIIR
ncbi:MAG: nitrilase [Alphaproteobacteria bacterium]|nr:nitrilase [Alphaproteobacteria bacterium]